MLATFIQIEISKNSLLSDTANVLNLNFENRWIHSNIKSNYGWFCSTLIWYYVACGLESR